ncbi:class I SAM-dependent DNA methyltransferase [Streptomyces sp. 12297]|uniref:class I SAM-dependent DNA methyltransferase n=1 Tax=Streptomyces sp. NBC_00239 TaxID=2903640 RepID=UPI002E29ACA2|nr:class I SAM-dependent methyltransferase [Streptomyces sp. NBC_00239]
MFTSEGPTVRELAVQALSSVEHGYDLLAPKFDHTPFRTPERFLTATTRALRPYGPFDAALDVCCGTGAGIGVLRDLGAPRRIGADLSAGMLAQAEAAHPDAGFVRADALALPFEAEFDLAVSFGAFGHFLPAERPPLFASVYRTLRPGGLFAFPIGAPLPVTSALYWITLGFDTAMRVRNAVWRPPFVMYYRTFPLGGVRTDLRAAGFDVSLTPLPEFGTRPDGTPRWRLVLARKP